MILGILWFGLLSIRLGLQHVNSSGEIMRRPKCYLLSSLTTLLEINVRG